MTRRRMLACAAALVALAEPAAPAAPFAAASLVRRVRGLVGALDRDALPAVAGWCDLDETELACAIVSTSASEAYRLQELSDSELRARIRGNIASDYRAGRVSRYGAWCVSLTESRVLELAGRSSG